MSCSWHPFLSVLLSGVGGPWAFSPLTRLRAAVSPRQHQVPTARQAVPGSKGQVRVLPWWHCCPVGRLHREQAACLAWGALPTRQVSQTLEESGQKCPWVQAQPRGFGSAFTECTPRTPTGMKGSGRAPFGITDVWSVGCTPPQHGSGDRVCCSHQIHLGPVSVAAGVVLWRDSGVCSCRALL